MGQKLVYWSYSAINVLFLRPFRLPRFPYLIVFLIFINTRGLFTNITTRRQSVFKENVKSIWYNRISNGWGCFIWLLSLQVTYFFSLRISFGFLFYSIFKQNFNLFSGILSWHFLIFVCFFVFLSFFLVYIDLVRLFIPRTPRNKFMSENIRAVEKT